jgi:hypothetical protein
MRPINILLVMLIFVIASCQSKNAVHLKTALEQKERTAFNILVGKKGPNERKLKCLIDGDFKCAQQAITEKGQAFDKIISEINELETGGIKYGNELKTATCNYYKAVKQLEVFDRHEIIVQQQSQKANTEQLRDSVIAKQGQLLKHKLEMRKVINNREKQLAEIQKQFNSVNHLN